MTEAEARRLLRDWPGDSGLEAWIAGRRWKAIPGVHSIKIQDEGMLKETISLENCPGHVFILGQDRAAIQKSIELLREDEPDVYRAMLA